MLMWNILWKRYQLDKFRDKLFFLRANLFDLAYKNEDFKYDSKLYTNFEVLLNGSIRYAYRISILDYIYFILFLRFKYKKLLVNSKFDSTYDQYIENIQSEKTKNKLNSLKKKYEVAIVDYLIFSSSILTLLFIITFIIALIGLLIYKLLNTLISIKKLSLIFQKIISNKIPLNAKHFSNFASVIMNKLRLQIENIFRIKAHKFIVETELGAELAH